MSTTDEVGTMEKPSQYGGNKTYFITVKRRDFIFTLLVFLLKVNNENKQN